MMISLVTKNADRNQIKRNSFGVTATKVQLCGQKNQRNNI